MSKRQDPAEQLLDFLVYAPLGLLMEARDLVPKLADKGRQSMGGQVTVARMIGEMAVQQGQRRAEKALQRLREQRGRPGASAMGTPDADHRPASGHGPPSAAAPEAASSPGGAGASPEAATLAIPAYDTLSASQVLPRLEGLSADELEVIRIYEEATRARKTVLSRIDQLRGSV